MQWLFSISEPTLKVITVHTHDRIHALRRDADVVLDHEGGQLVAVDEGDALVDAFFDEVGGFFRKAAGRDEEALACALADEGAEEFLDFRATDGAVGGPLFRLDVDAVEAETIGFDDAVDAFIAGLADDPGGVFRRAAVTHCDN